MQNESGVCSGKREGERLFQCCERGQCCAVHYNPSRGVETPLPTSKGRASNELAWTKGEWRRGKGGRPAHCGTALRRSRTLEGLGSPLSLVRAGPPLRGRGLAWVCGVLQAVLVLGPDLVEIPRAAAILSVYWLPLPSVDF